MTDMEGCTLQDKIAHSFEWGSSEVDWCESNFAVTAYIIEFWNTVSNLPFLILPPILMYLFREYGKTVGFGVYLVWTLLIIIGLGSAYFHATLSLFGQLWDELGILWVLAAAGALWVPKINMPSVFNQNRFAFQMVLLTVTILGSGLFTVIPGVNILLLFSLAVPAVYIFYKQHQKWSKTYISRYQAVLTLVLFFMAVTCWVSDKVFCDFWKKISFQYLHAIWHVLIAACSYRACVMMSYYHALDEFPKIVTSLKLWPGNCPQILAVPYVSISMATNNNNLRLDV